MNGYRTDKNVGVHEETDRCDKPPACGRVAVIDPESAEDVKRFDDLLGRFINGTEVPDYEGTLGCTRAALREFAAPTPPKPAEPTGLGAVVEDADGVRWIRDGRKVRDVWFNAEKPGCRPWSDLGGPLTVLSEGVQ